MKKKIFLAAIFCFFSACGQKNEISERQIFAEIPAGSRNIRENIPPTKTAKIISARGFFVGEKTFLTVAHFLPRGAKIKHFSEISRDDKNDLLLLKSEKSGKKLFLAAKNPKIGAEIFECETPKSRGKIIKKTATVAENIFGETQFLKNVFFARGKFQIGESGKPLCDAKKRVVGILVAVKNGGGFLIGAEKIAKFLN